MSDIKYNDLREFIEACKEIDHWKEIENADWNKEIGALTEITAELLPDPPMLIFDRIKDYPSGYRVVSLLNSSYKRAAVALGLPVNKTRLELIRLGAQKLKGVRPIPPEEVETGPVMENVLTGEDVDLLRFPSIIAHSGDGGRYIGSGDSLINQDPQSGFVNAGTYRMQVHNEKLLGLWMSPGQQGLQICKRYWDRGESCPVVATFGGDPLLFMASHTKLPWGQSELDYAGGLRERPLQIIKGPLTGLPIPAFAEIAIEGEVPPPWVEAHEEGPYGEWPGYYSGGTAGTGENQPVVRVKAIYHRNDPILHNNAPMWPGARSQGLPLEAGFLWDQLESAGIQDIAGVFTYTNYLVVVSIKQRYAGHAKQTGMATISCSAVARNGRYVVIVDEDIDPTDLKEVLWAMQTRVNPATDIEWVDGCWSTPLDPRMPPEQRANGDHTNSRAIFYAVRPFSWKKQFPRVSRTEKGYRDQMIVKYKELLNFPSM